MRVRASRRDFYDSRLKDSRVSDRPGRICSKAQPIAIKEGRVFRVKCSPGSELRRSTVIHLALNIEIPRNGVNVPSELALTTPFVSSIAIRSPVKGRDLSFPRKNKVSSTFFPLPLAARFHGITAQHKALRQWL